MTTFLSMQLIFWWKKNYLNQNNDSLLMSGWKDLAKVLLASFWDPCLSGTLKRSQIHLCTHEVYPSKIKFIMLRSSLFPYFIFDWRRVFLLDQISSENSSVHYTLNIVSCTLSLSILLSHQQMVQTPAGLPTSGPYLWWHQAIYVASHRHLLPRLQGVCGQSWVFNQTLYTWSEGTSNLQLLMLPSRLFWSSHNTQKKEIWEEIEKKREEHQTGWIKTWEKWGQGDLRANQEAGRWGPTSLGAWRGFSKCGKEVLRDLEPYRVDWKDIRGVVEERQGCSYCFVNSGRQRFGETYNSAIKIEIFYL